MIKKVLVTGGAGFIASNLIDECLRKGWNVKSVDNFSTGFKEMADPKRVSHLLGEYSFVEMDINETEKLTEAMKGCEVVFHLAALPRVSFSVEHPMEAHEGNSTGTLSVLEASRQAKVKRVVFSCSSSVFGGAQAFPTKETTPYAPLSPYALQKATSAEYCRLYFELYDGLDTVSLVYYNVFGPLQRTGGSYSTIIPAFLDCAFNNKPLRIDSDGKQSRDLTFVSDIVKANILSAEYEGELKGEKFNIACGKTHSVLEVYDIINGLFGGKLQKYHAPRRLGDPVKSHACIDKARNVLGYEPQVDLKSGLEKTFEWWLAGCPIK